MKDGSYRRRGSRPNRFSRLSATVDLLVVRIHT